MDRQYYLDRGGSDSVIRINFVKGKYIYTYDRQKIKIDDLFGKLGGLFAIIVFVFSFFV